MTDEEDRGGRTETRVSQRKACGSRRSELAQTSSVSGSILYSWLKLHSANASSRDPKS